MAKRKGKGHSGGRRIRRARRGATQHSVILTTLGVGTALIPFVMPVFQNQNVIQYLLAGNLGSAMYTLMVWVTQYWTVIIGPLIILAAAAVALRHFRIRISKHWRA
jgi:membrane protein CcdC involved in cytochrome C biogenesis